MKWLRPLLVYGGLALFLGWVGLLLAGLWGLAIDPLQFGRLTLSLPLLLLALGAVIYVVGHERRFTLRAVAIYCCLLLFLAWLGLLLAGLWELVAIDPAQFGRLTLSLPLLALIPGAIVFVVEHERTDRRQKEQNYLR